jgi:HEAT repeat protein
VTVSSSNRATAISTVSSLTMTLIMLSAACFAQTPAVSPWSLLHAGLSDKHPTSRVAAVRALGLVPSDAEASELAQKALKDPSSTVRAAAATALGQMHVPGVAASLKPALNDKSLSVVMAAAHALHSLNDPTCYEVYYEVYTGARKNDTGMIAQEMKVLHDPKQLAEMGVNEGIGYVPFAGMGWEAYQTIMKNKKDGAAAKAALISVLATDPDLRTGKLLLTASQNHNWVLRVAALEAIAKRGDPTLLPGVEPRLSDTKREVRFVAAATVIRLEDAARSRITPNTKLAQTTTPVVTQESHVTATALEAAK